MGYTPSFPGALSPFGSGSTGSDEGLISIQEAIRRQANELEAKRKEWELRQGVTPTDTAPRAGELAPNLKPNEFDYSPQAIKDQYQRFQFDPHRDAPEAAGQSTSENAPEEKTQITAVKMPDGRIVFTNVTQVDKEGKPVGEDVGYGAGVDEWKSKALAQQASSQFKSIKDQVDEAPIGEYTRYGDFKVQPGEGSYIPSAEVPLDLPSDYEKAKEQIAGIEHMGAREMAQEKWNRDEELRQAAMKRALMGAQAAETGASAGLIGAKAGQIAEPVEEARRQGRARAAGAAATDVGRYEESRNYVNSPRGQVQVEGAIAAFMADPRNRKILPKNPVEAQKLRERIMDELARQYATGVLPPIEQEAAITRATGMVPSYGYGPAGQ